MALQLESGPELTDDSGSGIYSTTSVHGESSDAVHAVAVTFILALIIITSVALYRKRSLSNPFDFASDYSDESLLARMADLGIDLNDNEGEEVIVSKL